MNIKRKIIFAILCAMILGGIVFLFRQTKESPLDIPLESKTEKSAEVLEERAAYEIALLRARKWNENAVLAHIASAVDPEESRYTFISESAHGRGFVVAVQGNKIITADETEYAGTSGAPFPSSAISQEKAAERVRNMPGYEDAEILGVEAVYGKIGEVWYFGVQTDKGTVSVEAR